MTTDRQQQAKVASIAVENTSTGPRVRIPAKPVHAHPQESQLHMKAKIAPRINLETRTDLSSVIPLDTPFILTIDPASTCNLRCTFCPTGDHALIKTTGRHQGILKQDLFEKIITDAQDFPKKIKVLRLYKDGEPLLNKKLPEMIKFAHNSGKFETIDTTTNAILLTPATSDKLIESGLSRINISINGLTPERYQNHTGVAADTKRLLDNIKHFYNNKSNCEICIKAPAEIIGTSNANEFLETYGQYCDRIFVENLAPCWPNFDTAARTGVTITKGIYQQDIVETKTCPYIFYSISINSDGSVSACFLDWARTLIVGDTRHESIKKIWTSAMMNKLRRMHLEDKRNQIPACANCGQLSHCLPDNIDSAREKILEKLGVPDKQDQ